jgi:formate dehydrogenase subunit gamma
MTTAAIAPGRRLRRFVVAERLSHWLYALFFLAALVSGLLTWAPSTRQWLAGARHTVTLYHGYAGAAMIILPLLLLVVLDRRRMFRDLREVDKWNGDDRRWFWLALRGYTVRGREMPPQGRFNAGQKVNVVLVAAMAVGFAATGGILMHKENMPVWLVSRALWLHDFLVVVAIAVFIGHLAHVFLTKHGRTYLAGMIRGWIPEELAMEKHRRWWEEETGGKTAPAAQADATLAEAAAGSAASDPDQRADSGSEPRV